jgi:hypothetical protein
MFSLPFLKAFDYDVPHAKIVTKVVMVLLELSKKQFFFLSCTKCRSDKELLLFLKNAYPP